MSSVSNAITTADQLFHEISSIQKTPIGKLTFGHMFVHVKSLANRIQGEQLSEFKRNLTTNELAGSKALIDLYQKTASLVNNTDIETFSLYKQVGTIIRNWEHFNLLDDNTKASVIKTRRLFMNPLQNILSRLFEGFQGILLVISSLPNMPNGTQEILFKEIISTEENIFSIITNNDKKKAISKLIQLMTSTKTESKDKALISIFKAIKDQIQNVEIALSKMSDNSFLKYKETITKISQAILTPTTTTSSQPTPPIDKSIYTQKIHNIIEKKRNEINKTLKDITISEEITNLLHTIESNAKNLIEEQNLEDLCSAIVDTISFELQGIVDQINDLSKAEQSEEKASIWIKSILEIKNSTTSLTKFQKKLAEGKESNLLNKKFQCLFGGSILHSLAKQDKHQNLISLAINMGCDPSLQDFWQNTPLIWAIANAANGVAMELLNTCKKGPYIDLQSLNQNTALHLAIGKGYKDKSYDGAFLVHSNLDLVRKLIELGANVNLQDANGDTPLHIACIRRDKEMIETLLKAGANPLQKNKKQQLPLQLLNIGYDTASKLITKKASLFLLDKKEYDEAINLHLLFLPSNI